MKDTQTLNRKNDHIQINLHQDVDLNQPTGLEKVFFMHNALPELDLQDIDVSTTFFSKPLKMPLMISSMTGGTPEGLQINQRLATIAEEFGLAMGVGSQRSAIDHPETKDTFNIRKFAPNIFLFANLGAVQLNYGYSVDECKLAIEMIQADALILHLNPLQEALQPEGQTNFSNLLKKIEMVCKHLDKPVIAKEVGWGISGAVARQLKNAGISAIDVAGAGGTSWSQVEMFRSQTKSLQNIASDYKSWGIPTIESLGMVKQAAPDLPIIASGGMRSGLDIAKCIALGASLCGIAGPLLRAASVSEEEIHMLLGEIKKQLKVTMFVTGSNNMESLKKAPVIIR